MQVDKWMKRRVRTVKPLDSIQHAREIMATERINQLPVVVNERLVGIVTDRDLRDAFPSIFERVPRSKTGEPAANADPAQIPVEMVMTAKVLTLTPAAPVTEAARLMRRERIAAIPIVDGERLLGIITRSDILDAFSTLAEREAGRGTAAGVPPVSPARRRAAKPRARRRKR